VISKRATGSSSNPTAAYWPNSEKGRIFRRKKKASAIEKAFLFYLFYLCRVQSRVGDDPQHNNNNSVSTITTNI